MRRAVMVVLLALLAAIGPASPSLAATTVPATAPEPSPPASTIDNPFIPEDVNLTECISAVPRPGCGSEARGGWHQTLVFIVIVAALALIGTRIVLAVRKRDRS